METVSASQQPIRRCSSLEEGQTALGKELSSITAAVMPPLHSGQPLLRTAHWVTELQ